MSRKWFFWTWFIVRPLFADPVPAEIFQSANQAFDSGEYGAAIEKYERLVDGGSDSGDLHFNLGNGYFKKGSVGRAIFHYRKALEFSPRDPDAIFNLAYAKEKVVEGVEAKEPLLSRLTSVLDSISERESYYALALLSFCLAWLAAIELVRKNEWIQWSRLAFTALVAVAAILVAYHTFWREPFGVIAVSEAKVFSGAGQGNVVLFALHEGIEFTVADTIGTEWLRIRLSDGKQGWIRAENAIFEKS